MSSTEKMKVSAAPISQTFIADGSKSRMIIPPFQREYSWGEDQIEDFWNDNIKSGETTSFIGTILVNPVSVKGQRHDDYEVVDGQQRITTIFLIKCALRDFCFEMRDKFDGKEGTELLIQVAHEINSSLRVKDSLKESTYKLKIGNQNRDFFESKILDLEYKLDEKKDKRGQNPVIKRFITNYFYIKDTLVKHYIKKRKGVTSAEGTATILDELRDIVNDIVIIEIKAYDKNDAIDVFQTINDRGTDLEKADLIKAMIFKKITAVKADNLESLDKQWNLMVENIQEIDKSPYVKLTLSKFLRYYWMSKYKFVTMSQLVRSFDKQVKQKDAKGFLEDLIDASEIMRDLACQGREDFLSKYPFKKNHYSYDHLMGIRIQGNIQCMVLLLSYMKFLNKNKPGKMNRDLFKSIDNFTFLYFSVCHKRANVVEQLYSKFAVKIAKTDNINEVADHIESFNSELKKSSPTLLEFQESFSQSLNYKQRKICSYLLARLELLEQTGEQQINWEQVNIDHILPQNSLRQKKDSLSEGEYKKFEEQLNQIGNLLLVSKKINSAKGAKAIKEGIDVILDWSTKGTDFKTTRTIAEDIKTKSYQWDYPDIITRTNQLCNKSFESFKL